MTKKVPIWLKDQNDNFIHIRMDSDGFFYIDHNDGVQVVEYLDKMKVGDKVEIRGKSYTVSRTGMVG